jgi:hypothetical protein
MSVASPLLPSCLYLGPSTPWRYPLRLRIIRSRVAHLQPNLSVPQPVRSQSWCAHYGVFGHVHHCLCMPERVPDYQEHTSQVCFIQGIDIET